MNQKTVLLAGGYGVVGRKVARLIRARHSDWEILLGGRSLEKAEALAHELGNAQAALVDVTQPQPLGGLRPDAIVQLVNDPRDYLMMDAAARGVALVDITRWTARMRDASVALEAVPLCAPIILASSWMGGIAVVCTLAAAKTLTQTDSVEIGICYSLKDEAGPNSVEYLDRLSIPFEITRNGKKETAHAMNHPRKVKFLHGQARKAYLFDLPDQYTLPQVLGAKTVLGRLTFDDTVTTESLALLVRSGIWKLFSGERFTSLRRAMLYNPGKGGKHQVTIEVSGKDSNQQEKRITALICDPLGQTHLTALGAVAQFERLTGLDGAAAPVPDVYYPENAFPQVESVLRLLKENGVEVNFSEE